MTDRKTYPRYATIIHDKNGEPIKPKTQGQDDLIRAIDKYDILFVNGPAGTGKTFLTICKAVRALQECKFEHLIVTRPAMESGEELGFLPGNMEEKIAPYMKPVFSSMAKLTPNKVGKNGNGNGNGKKKKKKNGKGNEPEKETFCENWYEKVEISPLAYMRGITLNNAFIISDESQNMTIPQMKMFLTRTGINSKVVITGDGSQSDLNKRVESGFRHAQKILEGVAGIGFITLKTEDIVRHKLVKDIIIKYEKNNGDFRNKVFSNREPH